MGDEICLERNETMLKIHNISRSYTGSSQTHTVIDHLNLTVCDHDFFVIVGPSGCGKSTLLRLIGGFDRPDSGSLLLDGTEITAPSKDIMMVFQSFDQLFPWYTVLGNLTYAMKKAGLFRTLAERKECARSYLSMAGLSGFENAYPHQFSGGMKQRAALARALSLKPKVLLMDEPFSSLDIATKKALYPVVTAMAAQTGCTILLVTHDIREARTLGSHIAVMSRQKKGISAVFSKEAMPEAETLEKMLEENA